MQTIFEIPQRKNAAYATATNYSVYKESAENKGCEK
jgi:hypothetical protein